MLVFEKFGQHQPLNRQAERYAREGVPLSLSTLADQVGACWWCWTRLLICGRARFAGARIHGDDTTVPVLAKGKTDLARAWVYVRDDRPFGGTAPPAAVFYYSRDRRATSASSLARYADFRLPRLADRITLEPDLMPGPIAEAACWAHSRTKIFGTRRSDQNRQAQSTGWQARFCLADGAGSGAPDRRAVRYRARDQWQIRRGAFAVRQQLSAPLVAELADWMTAAQARLSPHDDTGKAMNYMLNRWPALPGSSTRPDMPDQ